MDTASHELVDPDTFFAPVPWTPIDDLLSLYQRERNQVEQVAALFAGDIVHVVAYFFEGNSCARERGMSRSVAKDLFELPGAIAALNTSFWRRALSLTDFYDILPQARRDGWNAQFEKHETPEFTFDNVHDTFSALDADRMQFFAERVDGVFRALSHTHVTNSPSAFGQRFIFSHLVNDYGSYSHSRIGYIHDLRSVIAKFMGRDEPNRGATGDLVEKCRSYHRGKWVPVDGGSFRIRCYKAGTAHIEVHPDMAWRLNAVLAHLYPAAIPASFRTPPKRKAKEFAMVGRPLPFAVLAAIQDMDGGKYADPRILRARYGADDKNVRAEVERVLLYLGAVKQRDAIGVWFEFDYNPGEVIADVIASGCLPDQRAHQFYPTPEHVAIAAVEMADIGDEHECLEPSAGTGAIAKHMPVERTQCVEISRLHCKVLSAAGHHVDEADFLAWAVNAPKFDRIVMNPPYSEGRWQEHTRAAASRLAPRGRLVAILPASARGKTVVDGFEHDWGLTFDNAFAGTSISVVLLALERAPEQP